MQRRIGLHQKEPHTQKVVRAGRYLMFRLRDSRIDCMICPFCSQNTADSWQGLVSTTDQIGRQRQPASQLSSTTLEEGVRYPVNVTIQWLICQNNECNQIVVQVARSQMRAPKNGK